MSAPEHQTTAEPSSEELRDWFWHGVVIGLATAKAMLGDGRSLGFQYFARIEAQIDRIKMSTIKPDNSADGEREWQSWMIELELQSWERAANGQ